MPNSYASAEAAALLLAREELFEYGVLPINLLVPQLESLASLQTLHQRLVERAGSGADGELAWRNAWPLLDAVKQSKKRLLNFLVGRAGRALAPRGRKTKRRRAPPSQKKTRAAAASTSSLPTPTCCQPWKLL